MAVSTITGLTGVTIGNLTDAAVFEVEDSAAASRKATLAQIRTRLGTTASATAYSVGPNGETNPVWQIDCSTGSQAAGLKLTGATSAGTVALAVISSGAAANLSIDAKGTGTITLGGTSTGAITLTRATTLSAALTYGGVALSNAVTGTGNMVLSASPTLTGTVTAAAVTATGQAIIGAAAAASIQTTVQHQIVASLGTGTQSTLAIVNTHGTTPTGGLAIEYNGADPNGTGASFWRCYGTTTLRAEMRSNGGLANFSANDVNLSDERLKTNIVDLDSQWDRFAKLRVVRGRFKDQTHGDDNYMGLAQNVGKLWPELMDDANPKRLGIYETDLNWITRAVVQECQRRIERLETNN